MKGWDDEVAVNGNRQVYERDLYTVWETRHGEVLLHTYICHRTFISAVIDMTCVAPLVPHLLVDVCGSKSVQADR